jgi:hypothetical protein
MVDDLIRLVALGGSGGISLGMVYVIASHTKPMVEAYLAHRARVTEAREAAALPLAERLLLDERSRTVLLEASVADLRREVEAMRARCAACPGRSG